MNDKVNNSTVQGANTNWLNIGLTVLAIIILLFLIGSYYNHKKQNTESFNNPPVIKAKRDYVCGPLSNHTNEYKHNQEHEYKQNHVQPQKGLGKNEMYQSVKSDEVVSNKEPVELNLHPQDSFPRDVISPGELLPGDSNSRWAQVNPSGQG
jgi:hypothetical protein